MTGTTPDGPGRKPGRHRPRGDIISDRTATVVIYVVTGIWTTNILMGMFAVNGYQPSSEINGIFMAVVGGAFIARTRARSGGGD